MQSFEARVRPVTRYVVTVVDTTPPPAGATHAQGPRTFGEFDTRDAANDVCGAMARTLGCVAAPLTLNDQLMQIPQLLRNIADDLEAGEIRADLGVLSLRCIDQRRPLVFGFGPPMDAPVEFTRAAEEARRISNARVADALKDA